MKCCFCFWIVCINPNTFLEFYFRIHPSPSPSRRICQSWPSLHSQAWASGKQSWAPEILGPSSNKASSFVWTFDSKKVATFVLCIHKREKTVGWKKGRGRMMKIKCLIAFNNTRKMSAAEMNLVQGGVQLWTNFFKTSPVYVKAFIKLWPCNTVCPFSNKHFIRHRVVRNNELQKLEIHIVKCH